MPRLARIVWPGVPHHVTQRGNRREDVFFSDQDRASYLAWLAAYATKHGLDILAYCLMTNHVHLVAVPANADSLHRALKPLHMRHAQRINRAHGWTGHLWQGRFFSSALDETYTWAAIRYVERNPVRAGMVREAAAYRWSSAAAHCGPREDPVLTGDVAWRRRLTGIDDWSTWLAEDDDPDRLGVLRRGTDMGQPCGAARFIRDLERLSDRVLRHRPRGRPRKDDQEKG